MLVKFYKVDDIRDIHSGDEYIFQTDMDVVPRTGDTICTDEELYEVVDVCHNMTYDEQDHYINDQTDVTVIVKY